MLAPSLDAMMLLVLVMLVVLAAPAEAVWVNLTPAQVDQALAHGKATYEALRAARQPVDEPDDSYVVDLGRDVGRAIVFTEFSTLALEARRWAAIGQALKPEDVERILVPLRGRVRIQVLHVGPSRDSLRSHTVRLVQGPGSVTPARWDVFRGEPVEGDPGRWVAPGYYTFDGADLDLTAPAGLVLRDQGGREIRFDIDLSRIR